MSAPQPRANPILLGHAPAEAMLLDALRSGRMHHAWLITGPEGVGKATLAYCFARRLLAGIGAGEGLALDPSHPVFRRVSAGSHADLHTLECTINPQTKRLRSEIAIDDVRAAADFLRRTPAEGGWRVVVVDRADELNRNAANGLLKLLEEPPPRAILLLVCAAPGRLPGTVRSRCRRLRLAALSDPVMDELLAGYLPDLPADARGRLITLADGSPGRALLLAQEDAIALSALVDELLSELPDLAPMRGHAIADKLGRGDGGFTTFMDLLRAALADAVRAAARGHADPEQARLVALRPLDAWGDVWHALTRLQDDTERFALDKRHAILSGVALLTAPAQSVQ
ncbi:MAG TPA: DNA polymerase III subunit delta' [Acetobacteraceae bacterium]|nr:DNA polymerase III subunit delta' [Acetobacteraceae bacterium]